MIDILVGYFGYQPGFGGVCHFLRGQVFCWDQALLFLHAQLAARYPTSQLESCTDHKILI